MAKVMGEKVVKYGAIFAPSTTRTRVTNDKDRRDGKAPLDLGLVGEGSFGDITELVGAGRLSELVATVLGEVEKKARETDGVFKKGAMYERGDFNVLVLHLLPGDMTVAQVKFRVRASMPLTYGSSASFLRVRFLGSAPWSPWSQRGKREGWRYGGRPGGREATREK